MGEPNRCPYCRTGIPIWLYFEKENRYFLKCTHCDANGTYEIPVSASVEKALEKAAQDYSRFSGRTYQETLDMFKSIWEGFTKK